MDSATRAGIENRVHSGKTDEELIALCDTQAEAFGELVRRYEPLAFRAALSMLHNRVDAEDHVQSAFCKALQHIGRFERRAKFSTWLVRIVMNECLMQLRRSRRPHVSFTEELASEIFVSQERRWSPDSALQRQMLGKVVRREIGCIPPLLRNVFVLRAIERKPMQEVAAELGITVEAAKSRLCRARKELRRRLEPHVLDHVESKPLCGAGCEYRSPR